MTEEKTEKKTEEKTIEGESENITEDRAVEQERPGGEEQLAQEPQAKEPQASAVDGPAPAERADQGGDATSPRAESASSDSGKADSAQGEVGQAAPEKPVQPVQPVRSETTERGAAASSSSQERPERRRREEYYGHRERDGDDRTFYDRRFSRMRYRRRVLDTRNLKIDYKHPEVLARFISKTGKILPRKVTGATARVQRKIAREVKRARQISLLPFSR